MQLWATDEDPRKRIFGKVDGSIGEINIHAEEKQVAAAASYGGPNGIHRHIFYDSNEEGQDLHWETFCMIQVAFWYDRQKDFDNGEAPPRRIF
jgi:hypothetical protein